MCIVIGWTILRIGVLAVNYGGDTVSQPGMMQMAMFMLQKMKQQLMKNILKQKAKP